jgi:hypothetical protein
LAFFGPLEVVPTAFWFENCIFAVPGIYYLQVHGQNKLLLERPLLLTPFDRSTSNGEQRT